MDFQCVCGRRLTTERAMKIHRTKMGCLNSSTNQQQRTAQAGKRRKNKARFKTTAHQCQKINFPPASTKKKWEALDSKIVLKQNKLMGKSTLDHKFTTFGDIIYQTCVNNFGAKQHQAKREPKKGRKQYEIQTLQKQKKN